MSAGLLLSGGVKVYRRISPRAIPLAKRPPLPNRGLSAKHLAFVGTRGGPVPLVLAFPAFAGVLEVLAE